MNTKTLTTQARALCFERPAWIAEGSLSEEDVRFLLQSSYEARVSSVVEIGTASGFSSLVLIHALRLANEEGLIGNEYSVTSYDVLETFYANPSKRVGDAAREKLPPEQLRRITFHNPATAADVRKHHGENSISFLFVDADHRHPAPTIDLLLVLPCLAPGATVVLHDINLPLLHPSAQDWGVKNLFDGLQLQKQVESSQHLPNIGSFIVPEDKAAFETQLRTILFAKEWQATIPRHDLNTLGISSPPITNALTAIRESSGAHNVELRRTQIQIRFRNPMASEIRLVWGLDNFRRVPRKLPPGTFLTENGSHMNTPMKRQGDDFVLEFEIELYGLLEYAFTIIRTATGDPVETWIGPNDSGGYYCADLGAVAKNQRPVLIDNAVTVLNVGQHSHSETVPLSAR